MYCVQGSFSQGVSPSGEFIYGLTCGPSFFFFFFFNGWDETAFYFYFLAMLGLCCCVGFSLVAANRGYTLVAVCGLLPAVASPITEYGL